MPKNPTPQYKSIKCRAGPAFRNSRAVATSCGSRKKLFWKKESRGTSQFSGCTRSTTLMPPLGGGCARTWRICLFSAGSAILHSSMSSTKSAVGAHEADVQFLFRFVPLAADHDPVAVAVRRRAGDDRRDFVRRNLPHALEQVRDLLSLQPQLLRVINMLILAAAASAEITALRRNALRRRLNHAQQLRPRKILFDLGDFRFNDFASHDKRDEDDEIIHAPDAFAAEGNVEDGQGNFLACFEWHTARLRRSGEQKRFFLP